MRNISFFSENRHYSPKRMGTWIAEKFDWAPFCLNCGINILEELINQLHLDEFRNGYFQQDGATARITLN
jgi:hypothetical protein